MKSGPALRLARLAGSVRWQKREAERGGKGPRRKLKKGRNSGPFPIRFLLPVGLADFMVADATVVSHIGQQGIFAIFKM
jgi:hypothetical protein